MSGVRNLLFAFLLCLCVGCQQPPKGDVIATTGMIGDAVKKIAGGTLRVDTLMGPGIDPHKYSPSSGDLDRLSSAKLILFNGLHLEGKMVDVLEKPIRGQRSVAVTEKLDPKELRHAEGDSGEHDPHVWFDVLLWSKCVETIRDELCTSFPQHESEFRKNATIYLAELKALDEEVRKKSLSLTAEQRILVTSHDAFGYFGRAYGFEVRALQGVSTAASSSTNEVENLSKFIIDRQVPAIFTETSVLPKGLAQVLESVRSRSGRSVKLVSGDDALYSDALGEPTSGGHDYLGMVRHNIDVIVKGLK